MGAAAPLLYQTATWLILILAFILAYYKWSFQYWKCRNVPYIEPTFPFGNYKSLLNRKYHIADTIKKYYLKMKAQGHKYCGFYLLTLPAFVVIDPEICKLILTKDFQHFSNRFLYYNEKDDPISAHLLSVNGEKWRQMRSDMTPAFTSAKVRTLHKIITDCGDLLRKDLQWHYQQQKSFNAKEVFRLFTSNVIGVAAVGLDLESLTGAPNEFAKLTNKGLNFSWLKASTLLLASAFPKFFRFLGVRQVPKKCGDYFMKTIKEIAEHRENTKTIKKDFLQLLIEMRKKNALEQIDFTIEQMVAQCFIFFLAGYETSASTICFAMYEMAKNQTVQEKAREEVLTILEKYQGEITYEAVMEMKYVGQIIEESLRMYTPARLLNRICTKDYKIPDTDVTLEKGMWIVIPVPGIHHDPEFYPNPEIFDPDRFSEENKKSRPQYTWLPFGEGPRNCIGMRFAILEAKAALALCLSKFRYTLDPKTKTTLRMNTKTFVVDSMDEILLKCEKIND